MKVTVIIENPSSDFFALLAGMEQAGPALVTEQVDSAPEQSAPSARVTRGNTREVEVGDRVHWRGALYEFDGVVERINSAATGAEKAIFVRRSDTNKLVSLTTDDLVDYDLTILS